MRNDKPFIKVNFAIRCPSVRVVRDDKQLGIMSTDQARRLAQDADLDLVEVVSNARPPVCHIMDFDKYRYELKQKEKEQYRKQKQAAIELKEIRLRPGIQDHDILTKLHSVRKFLSEGKKVQLTLQFKNREITHKEEGFRVLNKIISELGNAVHVELAPRLEGFRITCRLQAK